jgi:DNA-binding transcriptional ArsR family regulator
MLSALLDGRALTARELAFSARVTPQTASTHLAKLTEAGLLSVIRDGRHRYFRLASPKVVDMLDGIVAVALEARPRYRPLSRQARELSAARICYDHLAGRLSVDLTNFFTAHEYFVLGDEAAEITPAGTSFLSAFGVDLSALSSTRRHFCRLCLDWTERRPHIAAAVGAALTKRYFDLGWTERMKHSRAIIVTALGKHGFSEPSGSAKPRSPMQSDSPNYLKGAVFGLAAVSIWAGWSAMTRLAVTTQSRRMGYSGPPLRCCGSAPVADPDPTRARP